MDECQPIEGGGRDPAGERQGRAVQVDPMNPTLKAPVSKRLKLKHDEPLSNFAFKFNLRRFSKEMKSVRDLMTEAGLSKQRPPRHQPRSHFIRFHH